MSDRIPLGERESLRLEFKAADALKDPEKVAREVVALLNAKGGEVWVGIREEGGRAVAIDPVSDPERKRSQLLDHLVDTIEPRLLPAEIKVESIEEGEGPVLLVTVAPASNRGPFAFLKQGGRHFVVRLEDRIRPMTREEIFSPSASTRSREEIAEKKVLEDRKVLLGQGGEVFWLRLEPGVNVSLDIQSGELREILQDPRITGNRFDGWNFSKVEHQPRVRQDRLVTDPEEYRHVEIRRDGGMVFSAPLESMMWKGEDLEIWPPILAEYIVSAIRVARVVYAKVLGPSDPVLADLALVGLKGWKLRAGTPGIWFSANRIAKFTDATDFVLDQPVVFRFEEIEREPDRCGYRLVERVYEAFGIRRENIPKFFDPETGRLVFPE